MTSEHPLHQGCRDPASTEIGCDDEFDDLPVVGIGGLGIAGKPAVNKRENMGDTGCRTLQREHGLLAQRCHPVARLGLGGDAPHLADPLRVEGIDLGDLEVLREPVGVGGRSHIPTVPSARPARQGRRPGVASPGYGDTAL